MTDFHCIVIGGGIVGVACANLLAQSGRSVVLLERHAQLGTETSSRNSGVIHAGLYYPPGSLKARSCTEGRKLLYERCARLNVGHRKLGKLVVATTDEEVTRLEAIFERAQKNGAGDIRLLEGPEAQELEPHVKARAALLSPESGIVDVHELIYSHKKQASDSGTEFSFETEVEGLDRQGSTWRVSCKSQDERFTVGARVVVNAAGLVAPELARLAGVDVAAQGLNYHFCKGDYFTLSGQHQKRIARLIYPLPSHAGLGVHLTKDLGGQVMAGPDAVYVEGLDYDVDGGKSEQFAAAIRRYYPDVAAADLSPAYSGIRPKLQGPNDEFRDFFLEEMSKFGAPGMIALIGIESPGVTASEALAKQVTRLASQVLA